jgi:ABC-type dipeptide/oligopeptide/nickel transport system ATPase subunit
MATDPRLDETRAGAAVQITEVSKTFGRGDTALVALDRISLSVAPGER